MGEIGLQRERTPTPVPRAGPPRHPRIAHLVVRVPGVGLRFEALAAEQSARLGRFLSALEEC